MAPSGTTKDHTAIDPISLLQAEAYAVETYLFLVNRFPDDSCLEQCLQGHRERFLALEQWLHRQGIKRVLAADAGPFSNIPPEALAGSLDLAMARLRYCEDCLMEDYRGLLHEADPVSGAQLRQECLAGQRQTVQALTMRQRHSLL